MTQCCKGCEKRWVDVESGRTCHGNCQAYNEFLAEVEEIRKKRALDRDFAFIYKTDKKLSRQIQSIREFKKRR